MRKHISRLLIIILLALTINVHVDAQPAIENDQCVGRIFGLDSFRGSEMCLHANVHYTPEFILNNNGYTEHYIRSIAIELGFKITIVTAARDQHSHTALYGSQAHLNLPLTANATNATNADDTLVSITLHRCHVEVFPTTTAIPSSSSPSSSILPLCLRSGNRSFSSPIHIGSISIQPGYIVLISGGGAGSPIFNIELTTGGVVDLDGVNSVSVELGLDRLIHTRTTHAHNSSATHKTHIKAVGLSPGFNFQSILILGDSLSDQINQYDYWLSGYVPNPHTGYWSGRFTNGFNWVDWLTQHPTTTGTFPTIYNLAWGGAQASGSLIARPSIGQQLSTFMASEPNFDFSTCLIFVWAGPNDLLNIYPSTNVNVGRSITDAIYAVQQTLVSKGASDIVVPGLPNLTQVPQAYPGGPWNGNAGDPAFLKWIDTTTVTTNQVLAVTAPIFIDVASFINSWVVGTWTSHNMNNFRTSCYPGSAGAWTFSKSYTDLACPQLMFMDFLHPSSIAHCGIAGEFMHNLAVKYNGVGILDPYQGKTNPQATWLDGCSTWARCVSTVGARNPMILSTCNWYYQSELKCGALPTVINGGWSSVTGSNVGSIAVLQCNNGYPTGPRTVTCQNMNGQDGPAAVWSIPGTCGPASCSVSGGSISLAATTQTTTTATNVNVDTQNECGLGVSCKPVAILYSGVGFTGSSQIVTAADVSSSVVPMGSAWQHISTACASNTPFAGAPLRALGFTVASVKILNPNYQVRLYGWYGNSGDSSCGPSNTAPDANGNFNSWIISNASPAGVVVISLPVAVLYSGVGFTGSSQIVTAGDVSSSSVAMGSAWQNVPTACATSTPFAGATLRSLAFPVASVQILNPAYKAALYGNYGNRGDTWCGPSNTSPDANGNFNAWTIANAAPAGVLVILKPVCAAGSYWNTDKCASCPTAPPQPTQWWPIASNIIAPSPYSCPNYTLSDGETDYCIVPAQEGMEICEQDPSCKYINLPNNAAWMETYPNAVQLAGTQPGAQPLSANTDWSVRAKVSLDGELTIRAGLTTSTGGACLLEDVNSSPFRSTCSAASSSYTAGYAFLDQNNAHGDVIASYSSGSQITSDGCKAACMADSTCGGVTFNPSTPVCYLNKPGSYWARSIATDNAWVKPDPSAQAGYTAGYAFLDQNNAHGDVIAQYTSGPQITADGCRAACVANSACGGVTWNPEKPICYLNKPGASYWAQSIWWTDHAWVKPYGRALWTIRWVPGTSNSYTIQSQYLGQCLIIGSAVAASSSNALSYTACNAADPHQQFRIYPQSFDSAGLPWFTITHTSDYTSQNELCLIFGGNGGNPSISLSNWQQGGLTSQCGWPTQIPASLLLSGTSYATITSSSTTTLGSVLASVSGSSARTWSLWVLITQGPTSAYASFMTQTNTNQVCGGNEFNFGWEAATGKISMTACNVARISSTQGTLALNTWAHVAVTFDGTNYIFYINGQPSTAQTLGGNINTANDILLLGARRTVSPTETFTGQLTQIHIYNRALSSAEIIQDMNNIIPTSGGLVLALEMDAAGIVDESDEGIGILQATYINGATTLVYPTQIPASLQLSGTSSYATITSSSTTPLGNIVASASGSNARTWSLWVLITSAPTTPYASFLTQTNTNQGCGANEFNFGWVAATGAISMTACNVARISSTVGNVKLNTWAHVAITFDGTNYIFYINGQPSPSQTLGGNINTATDLLILGARNLSPFQTLTGQMSQIHIYNRALSSGEIIQDMNNIIPTSGGLVLTLEMDAAGIVDKSTQGTGILKATYSNGATMVVNTQSSPLMANGQAIFSIESKFQHQ